MKSKGNRRNTPGSGGGLMDRLLMPRIENYALNHDYTDVDDVVDYLRTSYREYQRKQMGPFRAMVVKAVGIIQRRGGVDKPEIQLQAAERRHLAKSTKKPDLTPGTAQIGSSLDEGDAEEEEDEDGEGDSSGGELNDDLGEIAGALGSSLTPVQGTMNRSLLSMYSQGLLTPSSKDEVNLEADPTGPGEATPAATTPPMTPLVPSGPGGMRAVTEVAVPSMAPPGMEPTQPGSAPTVALGLAAPAEAPPKDKRGRTAGEAGLSTQPRYVPSRSAVKKARPSGANPRNTGPSGTPTPGGGANTRSASSALTTPRSLTYEDLGGIEEVLGDIKELIEYPLKHPEVYAWLGVDPPRGVLLHGPPGCGKTALANAIANECGVPFLKVSAPEVVSGMSGESEAKLRQLFQEARDSAPCIVFIDEIDAIATKRETAQREMERRIVAQMLTCMDDLAAPLAVQDTREEPSARSGEALPASRPPSQLSPHVVVIGATNRPDALDPALRRAGRFDRELSMGIPSESARVKILEVITRGLRLEGDFDFAFVAKRTPGFVGADLTALAKEAAAIAVKRVFSRLEQGSSEQGRQQDNGRDTTALLMASPLDDTGPSDGSVDLRGHGPSRLPEGNGKAHLHPAGGSELLDPAPSGALGTPGGLHGEEGSQGGYSETPTGMEICPSLNDSPSHPTTELGDPRRTRFGQGPLQPHELSSLAITMADFAEALPKVQPSVRREGFTTKPDVTWEDVGSLDEVREDLSFAISQPIAHPEQFQAMGLTLATGVLLYGPPGCGKTLVAKAVASESGANFISIKGPELLNKYVGESERAVRQLFARARAAHPCVLFFDEMDALAPRRGSDANQAAERLVNQLLTEMDGVDGRLGVFIIAATNRPDMIDPALLRPGRLDKVLYVPLPPPAGRVSILRALTRKTPLAPDVDLEALGLHPRCEGFSGADCAALVREACVVALKESLKAGTTVGVPLVHSYHFQMALQVVLPSVSRQDQRVYDALRSRLRTSRGHVKVDEEQEEGGEGVQPKAQPGGDG